MRVNNSLYKLTSYLDIRGDRYNKTYTMLSIFKGVINDVYFTNFETKKLKIFFNQKRLERNRVLESVIIHKRFTNKDIHIMNEMKKDRVLRRFKNNPFSMSHEQVNKLAESQTVKLFDYIDKRKVRNLRKHEKIERVEKYFRKDIPRFAQ